MAKVNVKVLGIITVILLLLIIAAIFFLPKRIEGDRIVWSFKKNPTPGNNALPTVPETVPAATV